MVCSSFRLIFYIITHIFVLFNRIRIMTNKNNKILQPFLQKHLLFTKFYAIIVAFASCDRIWKRIEVVITGLTRNQLYLTVPRVRIPPLPPKSQEVTLCDLLAFLWHRLGENPPKEYRSRFARCERSARKIFFLRSREERARGSNPC